MWVLLYCNIATRTALMNNSMGQIVERKYNLIAFKTTRTVLQRAKIKRKKNP